MAPSTVAQTVVFALLSAVVLVPALWVVSARNLFRAALSLGLVLIGVAGLFILLEAEFLAFVQILVYVGAILTMVVFAIMLTARLQTTAEEPAPGRSLPAALASTALFGLLAAATQSVDWLPLDAGEPVSAAAIGQQLVGSLVLPFEVVSFVFVAAMVGAMVVAGRNPNDEPRA